MVDIIIESALLVLKWGCSLILGTFLMYVTVRILATAIFRSYYEVKKVFDNQTTEPMKGK